MQEQKNSINGILVVDKPSGMTSHDVVDVVRKKLKMKRVGHAGTLDPLATGVLVMLIGKATKRFIEFSSCDKEYLATITLGKTTDTADIEGKILEQKSFEHISESMVKDALKNFSGEIQQIPPMVSALKHKGKRLYELAREGIKVEIKPRTVYISSIELVKFSLPHAQVLINCSKGTYVRKIAEDVGSLLGCGGCITQIRRTKSGSFDVSQAKDLNSISAEDVDQSIKDEKSNL